MIIEAIIAGTTLTTLGSFWLADRILKRQEEADAEPSPKPNQRREELEKQRDWWRNRAMDRNCTNSENRDAANMVAAIDKQLLELEDEQ